MHDHKVAVANAGNHLHLLIQAPSKNHLSNFLRGIAGRIAQLVSETTRTTRGVQAPAQQMQRHKNENRFWDARPFSRIVSWGKDFKNVARYITINSTEMAGLARIDVRAMFDKIKALLAQGLIPKTPGLVAAGFG